MDRIVCGVIIAVFLTWVAFKGNRQFFGNLGLGSFALMIISLFDLFQPHYHSVIQGLVEYIFPVWFFALTSYFFAQSMRFRQSDTTAPRDN